MKCLHCTLMLVISVELPHSLLASHVYSLLSILVFTAPQVIVAVVVKAAGESRSLY